MPRTISASAVHADVAGIAGALRLQWRLPLLGVALLLGIAGRAGYSWHAPLWFDETFTAVIATQPDFRGLLRWCLTELTGPAFYMPMWAWTGIAGSSNLALRLPSLILAIATPLLILWRGHADRNIRLWWAVFALLWVPIFCLAGEARPYPQLFLLGTAQAMLFLRLLADPNRKWASAWIVASMLLILTHYWGAVPCLVQGFAFLLYHRLRAVATWPAALLLLPMFVWAYFHLPMVLGFTMPADFAHAGLPLSAVGQIPAMIFGINFNGSVVLATVIGSIVLALAAGRGRGVTMRPELVLALCGVGAIGVMLVFAFLRPAFAPRYMIPIMPSFLFGLALWARWMCGFNAKAVIVVAAMTLSSAAGLVLSIFTEPDTDARHLFNLEQPSAWLAEGHPDRLVMFWDGPIASMTPSSNLDAVGGFFLRRTGRPLTVAVARAETDQDPNRAVLALAGTDSAILWTANDALPDSRRPRIELYDPRFECKDFGGGQLTMTACRPRRPR